jgi:hypothetical protein
MRKYSKPPDFSDWILAVRRYYLLKRRNFEIRDADEHDDDPLANFYKILGIQRIFFDRNPVVNQDAWLGIEIEFLGQTVLRGRDRFDSPSDGGFAFVALKKGDKWAVFNKPGQTYRFTLELKFKSETSCELEKLIVRVYNLIADNELDSISITPPS